MVCGLCKIMLLQYITYSYCILYTADLYFFFSTTELNRDSVIFFSLSCTGLIEMYSTFDRIEGPLFTVEHGLLDRASGLKLTGCWFDLQPVDRG